ncbi:hypothetical protein BC943DRAFT_130695 [Umbelopsis sp. AD052]|nr:hypothetical protein BC943DRAFT_130695 [Umbelopsis sp. AD052]
MRASLIFSTIALAFALGVTADHITIESPIENAKLKASEKFEVRYRVQYQDMALLGSAATSLLYANGSVAVANFSSATHDDWNDTRMVSVNWTIPQNISDGPYVLQVAGPAGYRCSKNNDGKAPWTRCYLTLSSQVNVTIGRAPAGQAPILHAEVTDTKNTTGKLLPSMTTTVHPTAGHLLQVNHSAVAVYPSILPKVKSSDAGQPVRMNLVEAAVNSAASVQLTIAYVFMTLVSTMCMLQ